MKLYRPATVLVGVLLVLLGGLTRLAGADHVYETQTREIVRGTIGEKLKYDDSTVTVDRIRFAKTFLAHESDQKAARTDGIFVAVEYDASRGPKNPSGNSVSLVADGGTEYLPVTQGIGTSITFPEPGFAESGAFVFEVNPADLKGLTLKVTTTMFFTVLGEDLAIDLGVPSKEIAKQLVDGAAQEYLMPKAVTRVTQ